MPDRRRLPSRQLRSDRPAAQPDDCGHRLDHDADTPACFFQSAALAVIIGIFAPNSGDARRPWRWLIFGILMGFARIQNTPAFCLASPFFWRCFHVPRAGGSFSRPGLAGGHSQGAVFSPVLIWNARISGRHFVFSFGTDRLGKSAVCATSRIMPVGKSRSALPYCSESAWRLC